MESPVQESNTTPPRSATSEDLELLGLVAMANERRRDLGLPEEPLPLSDLLPKSAERLARRVRTDEEIANDDREREMARRASNWDDLIGRIGKRYAECRRKNFKLSVDVEVAAKQRVALDALDKLAQNFQQHLETGGNLILYGPPGTGKDHLLVSLLRFAVFGGCDVHWCNGQDLFGEFRDRIDGAGSEMDLVRRYCRPEILAVSDPVQPKGEASAYATSMLYRIIDGRYRQQKCTWFTVNVASSKEGAESISAPVFDRMRDNAVTVFCNWPSYRHTNKPEWLK